MSRKKKFLLNTITGILKQIVTVICGFLLPRYMLLCYGSSVNGLLSSVSHFLSFITFLDMGVGAVIMSNLYKPLADKDSKQISLIVKSSERFFRRIAFIFLCYILFLCVVYPIRINTDYDFLFTISLIIIISISTLAQYLFGMTYQLLLNADQKAYVPLTLQMVTIVLNTVFSIILMKMGATVHIVKLTTAIVFVLRPLGQMWYVNRHYQLDRNIHLVGEPIKQKWNGFSQHMAAVVVENIDIVVLTLFSSLESISVYSVYYMVTSGVEKIIMTAATGLESLFGNMIAKQEDERLLKTFCAIEWGIHTIVTIVFSIAAITIVPFIKVYTRGIDDANYIAPLFGVILVIAYATLCLRVPYFRIIKAAGHFKQTQNGAFISAGLNIIITISLVIKYGLVGVAIGTFIAMIYHTCYFVWYLSENIIFRNVLNFVGYLITDSLIGVLSYWVSSHFILHNISYMSWLVLALKASIVVILICSIINLIFYRQQVKDVYKMLKGQIDKK